MSERTPIPVMPVEALLAWERLYRVRPVHFDDDAKAQLLYEEAVRFNMAALEAIVGTNGMKSEVASRT